MLDIKPGQNANQRLNEMMNQAENNGENFKLGIILLSVFILVLLVISGTYFFRSRKSLNQLAGVNQSAEILDDNKNSNKIINQEIKKDKDTDGDGLSDDDELMTHKTDPNKADTDNDKLLDKEEIMVYKTDPLKSDTDGDGKFDGEEIKLRRDPLDPSPNAEWPPRPTNLQIKK